MRFGRGLAVELDGLLRTEIDEGEALRAVIAAMGFDVREGDVPLRAHVGADAAATQRSGLTAGVSIGSVRRCIPGRAHNAPMGPHHA